MDKRLHDAVREGNLPKAAHESGRYDSTVEIFEQLPHALIKEIKESGDEGIGL